MECSRLKEILIDSIKSNDLRLVIIDVAKCAKIKLCCNVDAPDCVNMSILLPFYEASCLHMSIQARFNSFSDHAGCLDISEYVEGDAYG